MANKAPIFLLLRLQAAAAAAISCCPGGLVLVAVKFRISGCTGMRLAPLHDKGGSLVILFCQTEIVLKDSTAFVYVTQSEKSSH